MIEKYPWLSSGALVLANLVPLAGVLWFDWQVFDVLMLYWAENVIIGIINVARMAVSSGGLQIFMMAFFAVHYGFFCYGHLMAVTGLFSEAVGTGTAEQYFFGLPLADAWRSPLWLAIGGIAISHLISFFSNFIGDGEYRRTTANQLMQRPYGRIFVLHFAIIAGAALIEWLGSPVMMLVVLIAAKIALDLRLHRAERDKFAATAQPT